MTYLNAPNVVSRDLCRAVSALGPTAERVLDRWASGWPKATRELEKSGRLLEAVKSQADREASLLVDARMGGENNHLADHELFELYGISFAPPAP